MSECLSGKSEQSYSVPQYFSWINNNNDGSTEEQTLINLDFFGWLKEEFGVQLGIFALDAGNFDSPLNTYYDPEQPTAKKNYPDGYVKIAERAKQYGFKLGFWCGPDGFGDTPEEEERRTNYVVDLCRKYNVGLLKFDLVCGSLRVEKQKAFERMIAECRKYCPELVVLNHRIDMGDAQRYATTFLWGGMETYIDVLMTNVRTAPHHRECGLERGLVPEMQRLTEDHGVCLSSFIDYFEDELILQAFNRALILSPEIYGTPAFLRDDEIARLARIYNLADMYKKQLISGFQLDEKKYGSFAVSRGDEKTRIITLRNASWTTVSFDISVSDEIGLGNGNFHFIQYHPTQKYLGKYAYGDKVKVEVMPFRTYMAVITDNTDELLFKNCEYEVIKNIGGKDAVVNIIKCNGIPELLGNEFLPINKEIIVDKTVAAPVFLTKLEKADAPENSEQLYEATAFAADSDCLEAITRKRYGKTKYPAVQKCRDAFFAQEAYRIKGLEAANMFDGKPDTFFDAISRLVNSRINNGCLRIDLGELIDIDAMTVEYFCGNEDEEIKLPKNTPPQNGNMSADFLNWTDFGLDNDIRIRDAHEEFPWETVERSRTVNGEMRLATYTISDKIRYIRLPEPMDRIYNVRFFKDGHQIVLKSMPKANNMLSAYPLKKIRTAQTGKIVLPDYKKGSYLSFTCDGQHGVEGVYCAAICDGEVLGCYDRAPSYHVNHWEHYVCTKGDNYTYYLRLPDNAAGKEIELCALICADGDEKFATSVYLCDSLDDRVGEIVTLKRASS